MSAFVVYRILAALALASPQCFRPCTSPKSHHPKSAETWWRGISCHHLRHAGDLFRQLRNLAGGSGDAWLNSIGWRYMFLSGTIPAALFLLLLLLVPETPRFLMLKGREDDARAVLTKLVTPEEREKELSEIRASLSEHHSGKLFYSAHRHSDRIAVSVFQQFVGINVVLYYASDIFKGMGMTPMPACCKPSLWRGQPCFHRSRHCHRRPLRAQAVADRRRAGYGRRHDLARRRLLAGRQRHGGPCSHACLHCRLRRFMGPGHLGSAQRDLSQPDSCKAMAIAVAAQWVANYLVSWSFPILDENPYLVQHFKHGFAYWLYGGMGILAALFMAKFVPETKGRTLEQMEALWKPSGHAN